MRTVTRNPFIRRLRRWSLQARRTLASGMPGHAGRGSSPRAHPPIFRLLRNFSICAAIVIAVMTIALSHIFVANDRIVAREAIANRHVLMTKVLANAAGPWIRELVSTTGNGASAGSRSPAWATLHERLARMRQGVPLLTAEVIVAVDPQAALLGGDPGVARNLPALQDTFATGRYAFVLEEGTSTVYLPILDAERRAVAVLATTADTSHDQRMSRLQHRGVTAIVLAAFLSLFTALFLFVQRADTALRRQYGELSVLNATLEQRVAERSGAAERAAERARKYNELLVSEVEERRRIEDELIAQRQSLIAQQAALSQIMAAGLLTASKATDLVALISRTAAGAFEGGRFGVWRFASGRDALECIGYGEHGVADPALPASLRRSEHPRLFEAAQNAREATLPRLETHVAAGTILVVPIVRDGRSEGIVMVDRAATAHDDWTPEQRLFATAVASVVSLVLEGQERNRAESELREANRSLAAAARNKALLLAGVSHELRAPMNGVFGMTELLLRTPLDEQQRRLVTNISHSASGLLPVLNGILDMSRAEAGSIQIERTLFDLRAALQSVVDLASIQAYAKGLDIGLCVAPDLPVEIVGDAAKLRQVVVNVVTNAVKFTEQGEVAVRAQSTTNENGQPRLTITVSDTGIGIDAAAIERLFSPYTQADSSISRRFGGTGLGLAISRQLVTAMGGRVAIASAPGEGTTVSIELPLQAADSSRPSSALLAGLRVAVIGAPGISCEIAVASIVEAGGSAIASTSGDSAQPTGLAAPDAIVVLLDEAGANLEPAKAFAGTSRRSVPVIVVAKTGATVERSERVAEVLMKPLRGDALVAALTHRHQDLRRVPASRPRAAIVRERAFDAHVLVAEDNPINAEVARAYLEELGCRVSVVTNGHAAVRTVAEHAYDLVLMDWEMPGLNGLEAAVAIRRAEETSKKPPVPIVAVTANVFDGDRRRCLEAGMTAFLAKPFRAEDFRTVVAPLLDAARGRSAAAVTEPTAAKSAPKRPAAKARRRTPIAAGA